MDLLIGFLVFIGSMVSCTVWGFPMVIALVIGFLSFFAVGRHRGFSAKALLTYAWNMGGKDSLVVVWVMMLIGILTAFWRSSGTITFFVYYGIKIITPSLFILITFLLSCLLSYALGTSFGVAGTVGIIFMALAKTGGVDPLIAAGAVFSGIFFGDRGSPVSSSALLVAAITKSNIYDNVSLMRKSVVLPMTISIGFYGIMSYLNPIKAIDPSVSKAMEDSFSISFWLIIPALLILVLPLFRINVLICMAASILSGFLLTIFLQGESLTRAISYGIFGFTSKSPLLEPILNGGGLLSMIEICGIVLLSCSFSGIFRGTNMLSKVEGYLKAMSLKVGRFTSMVILSLATNGIFCNQTLSSIMCNDMMTSQYSKDKAAQDALVLDLENSVIVLCPFFPWSIAFTVPATMFGVGYGAMAFAVLLYLIPICHGGYKAYSYLKSRRT